MRREPAQTAPAVPSVTWERSVTASVMWLSSTQSQTAVSLAADATATSTHWVHAIAGEENFVSVKFGDQSQTVADSQSLRYLARYAKSRGSRSAASGAAACSTRSWCEASSSRHRR